MGRRTDGAIEIALKEKATKVVARPLNIGAPGRNRTHDPLVRRARDEQFIIAYQLLTTPV